MRVGGFTAHPGFAILRKKLDGYTALKEVASMMQANEKPAARVEMSGVERLGLRVSEMINHPIAQIQRWVTIHRLDTDGDREWEEVMGVLSATDGLDLSVGEDGGVTVRWDPIPLEDRLAEANDESEEDAPAPF